MSPTNRKILSFTALLLVLFAVGYTTVKALEVDVSSNVFITAQVGPTTGGGGNGGGGGGGGGGGSGGGGGGGGSTGIPTTVNFSGMGYPFSKVVILQDGVSAITTISDAAANFSASITGLTAGNYTFSVYTTDTSGRHSVSFSFPVYVTDGATINIGDIILAPTIDVDKSEVKQGEPESIFGYSVPNSAVNITVHSAVAHEVTTKASASGAYLYDFDTTPLELGTHDAQSNATLANVISATTDPVSFIVGDTDISKQANACDTLIGDINCDGKVNLVDFSILAYWYKKGTQPPANVDLNGDGVINLVDFSILAYHWTG